MTNPYVSYYLNQAGTGVGPVFRGAPYQRGHGIGSWLSSIFRSVFPMLKSGAKTLGQEALNAGFGVLRDAITRKPLRESLKSRMREAGSNLMNVAEQKIDTMKGSGYKRKRKIATKPSKRPRLDIFS